MHKLIKAALLGATASVAIAGSAMAADLVPEPPMEPQVVVAPPPVYQEISTNGWYLRGDVDYHQSDLGTSWYQTYNATTLGYNTFRTSDLDGSWSIGAGAGYKINRYLRADVTVDWFAKADFTGSTVGTCGGVVCTSSDSSAMSAWLLLANAYVDLGTWGRFTPYVGAGIGGAHVKWDNLSNTAGGTTTSHRGTSSWRLAYALMAGTSYCINDRLEADLGYRFTHIEGGRMFEYADSIPGDAFLGAGPGYDDGINTHEVRAGLRYKFGGSGRPCGGEVVAYQPPEYIPPVYK